MPATEAQIRANQQNAAKSTGPKTEEGKARSRTNSYKHGLTGQGVVMPEADAARVERLAYTLQNELQAPGETGALLTRRMAVLAVRMDRAVVQESAAITAHVLQVMDDFEVPEGVDELTAEKLRKEAGEVALFNGSEEACLARKYEAAAERGFFRALTELRRLKKELAQADPAEENARLLAQADAMVRGLGSFSSAPPKPSKAAAKPAPTPSQPLPNPPKSPEAVWDPFAPAPSALPIAIGRPR